MKYLCLGYFTENALAALRAGGSLHAEAVAYHDDLRRSGHCLDFKTLEGGRSAATLRFDGGKVTVTDGPFAETKEQLGGLMILEATDLNHAIQLMSQLPAMRHTGGSLEIRPICEDLPTEETS
jgi:hypothetical protein